MAQHGVALGGDTWLASLGGGRTRRPLSTVIYRPWRQQPEQGGARAIKCPRGVEGKGKLYLAVNDWKEYLKTHGN